jgi:type III restriction enzyme
MPLALGQGAAVGGAEGSTVEVDFRTSKDVREIIHSHLNYAIMDTQQREQSATYTIDHHGRVDAFVKNASLGFAIPYIHNGQPHDYLPDFIIRLKGKPVRHLILETKGYDQLAEVKAQAAIRWVEAVNAEGSYGEWLYAMARKPEEVAKRIEEA